MTTQGEDLGKAITAAAEVWAAHVRMSSLEIATAIGKLEKALTVRGHHQTAQDALGEPATPRRALPATSEAARPAETHPDGLARVRDLLDRWNDEWERSGDVDLRYVDELETALNGPDDPPPVERRRGVPLAETDWPDVAPPNLTDPEPRPDWADALAVRDDFGAIWAQIADGLWLPALGGTEREAETSDDLDACRGPVSVVLDGEGSPPAPEPEWLDADALGQLPLGSIVIPRSENVPRVNHHGGWFRTPGGMGVLSRDIAPAHVLWTPEDGR